MPNLMKYYFAPTYMHYEVIPTFVPFFHLFLGNVAIKYQSTSSKYHLLLLLLKVLVIFVEVWG